MGGAYVTYLALTSLVDVPYVDYEGGFVDMLTLLNALDHPRYTYY